MEKRTLAQELRNRQYQQKIVEKELIDILTDDQIIEAYITCSGCGAKFIAPEKLPAAITNADDVDDFLAMTMQSHHH